jgi:hypothetical protein
LWPRELFHDDWYLLIRARIHARPSPPKTSVAGRERALSKHERVIDRRNGKKPLRAYASGRERIVMTTIAPAAPIARVACGELR